MAEIKPEPKPKPRPKPHPIHSGEFSFLGDSTYSKHVPAAAQDALRVCLHAIRGLTAKSAKEALLGHLLAQLVAEQQIDGLVRSLDLATHHINHYHALPGARRY